MEILELTTLDKRIEVGGTGVKEEVIIKLKTATNRTKNVQVKIEIKR